MVHRQNPNAFVTEHNKPTGDLKQQVMGAGFSPLYLHLNSMGFWTHDLSFTSSVLFRLNQVKDVTSHVL